MKNEKLGFRTRAIHAGQKPEEITGAIMTPIFMSSTYVQESPGVHRGYEYSRTSNPTRQAFEDCLASLESGKKGFVFSSGCGATTTVLHLLKNGDHVIANDDMYGGTFRLFDTVIRQNGIDFSYVDLREPQNFEETITKKTKMVWLETPTNPTLRMVDIEAIVQIAHKKGILVAVDNTFMSPYFQRPLELGADIVVHSTTKYINGHSDVIGGAVIVNSEELGEKIHYLLNSMGTNGNAFDSFLGLRSLKTLALRMESHQKNAMVLADFLESHDKVERVIYPGLKSFPQYELACRQMSGFGGMITFYLKGSLKTARQFLESVQIFALAESLGGVESLIEHPAIMTHASVPIQRRAEQGIDDSLIRLSVGVEDVDDLRLDLAQALDRC